MDERFQFIMQSNSRIENKEILGLLFTYRLGMDKQVPMTYPDRKVHFCKLQILQISRTYYKFQKKVSYIKQSDRAKLLYYQIQRVPYYFILNLTEKDVEKFSYQSKRWHRFREFIFRQVKVLFGKLRSYILGFKIFVQHVYIN